MVDVNAIEHYTAEDYRRWQGDWELIQGTPCAMAPSPTATHQFACAAIFRALDDALGDCPQYHVLFEIDVEFSADTVVRPDLIVICHEPEGDWVTRAPEMIVEVVSTNSARRDESVKFDLYEAEGVTYYMLVYPDAKKVKAYRLVDGSYRKLGDYSDERPAFELSQCRIGLDVAGFWRRKG